MELVLRGANPRLPDTMRFLCLHLIATTVLADTVRIHFGSCSDPSLPQPLWPWILARHGAAFLWSGDIIYADKFVGFFRNEPGTDAEMREAYAAQHRIPGYAELVRRNVTILGTWDDHDFGINDGDRTFIGRDFAKRNLLEFLGEPADTLRSFRAGVYDSRLLDFGGPARQVLVILLDNRYFKDPFSHGAAGDMLGAEQWEWLEATLCQSSARAHLIVSGLQILPEGRPGENWARFPGSREKLLRTLQKCQVRAPILISGDVHMAELSEATCTGPQGWAGEPRSLVEVTSSGLTHAWGTDTVWRLTRKYFFGVPLLAPLLHWAAWCFWFFGSHPYRLKNDDFFLGLNFGEVEFDFDADDVVARIFDRFGTVRIERSWQLSKLDSVPTGGHCSGKEVTDVEVTYKRFTMLLAMLFPVFVFFVSLVWGCIELVNCGKKQKVE